MIEISSIEKSLPLALVETFLIIKLTVWLVADVKSMEANFQPNEFCGPELAVAITALLAESTSAANW